MQHMISLKLSKFLSLLKPPLVDDRLFFIFCLSIGLIVIMTSVVRMGADYNQSLSNPKTQGISSKGEKFKQIQIERQMIAALQEIRMHNVLRQQHPSANKMQVSAREVSIRDDSTPDASIKETIIHSAAADDSLSVDMSFYELKPASLPASLPAPLPDMYGW